MSRVLDALNSSGIGQNWLSGNINPGSDKASSMTGPPATPSFMGDVGKTLAGGAQSVAGFIGHTIAAPAEGLFNVGKGIVHNVDNVSHQIAIRQSQSGLMKQNTDNHKLLAAGKMSQGDFTKASQKLLDQWNALQAEGKKKMADTYTPEQYMQDMKAPAILGATLAAPAARLALEARGAVVGATGAAKVGQVAAKAGDKMLTGIGASGPAKLSLGGAATSGAGMITHQAINTISASAATEIPGQIKKGDYAGALGNAAILASPLGFAAMGKVIPKIGEKLATSMYGKQGFFDAVAKNGGPNMLAHLDSAATPGATKRIEGLLRQVQDYNLQQFKGDAKAAGAHFVEYLKNNGRDIATMDAKGLEKELQAWVGANRTIQKLHSAGEILTKAGGKAVTLAPGERMIAARWDQNIAGQVKADLMAAGSRDARNAVMNEYEKSGADWTKNKNLMSSLKGAAASGDGAWAKEFGKVQRMRSLFTASEKAKLPTGYIPAISKSARADFKAVADTAALDRGVKAGAVMGRVGKVMEKVGISTASRDLGASVRFKAKLAGEIKAIPGLELTPKQIAAGLKTKADSMKGIMDERQLTISNIKDTFNISHDEAKAIKGAYLKAYSKTSAADLGLAGRVENGLYHIPGYGLYRRIQGVAKYEMNPFFRTQERTESEVLAQLRAGGKHVELPGSQMINRIFAGGKNANQIDSTVNLLKENKIFSSGSGFEGHGGGDFSAISAKISHGQQRSVAGLVNTMAEKQGMKAKDFIGKLSPAELDNIVSVVQYPKKGLSSSNFAKTLNLLSFPGRYNIKLAGMLGEALIKASPVTQIATLKAASDLHSFLRSDEGIRWQSQNSEVLGMIAYLNPANNLNATFKLLSGEHVGLTDFGQIGGLPLGFVASALQDTGLVPKPSTAYLNPKTGEVIPDKLPTSMGGYAKTVLADLINSMYSFPGRTFGTAYSKTKLTQGLPGLAMKLGDQVNAPTPKLTPQQIRTQQVLGAGKSTKAPTAPPRVSTVTAPKLNLADVSIAPKPGTIKYKAPRAKIYGIRPK